MCSIGLACRRAFEIEHAGARFLGQSLSKELQKRIDAASFAREGIHFSF